MDNNEQKFYFSNENIEKLNNLFFNNEVFLYSDKCEYKKLNSFIQIITKSINSANSFDFENNIGSDSNLKQLFADYCNIIDCSKFIMNFFRVSGKLRKTNYFASYYKYNKWKNTYNEDFKKEIEDNKVKKINYVEYGDRDYFEYLRCLLLAHPLECSFHVPTRDIIRIVDENGIGFDKSESHYLFSSKIIKDNDEYKISIKALSTTKEYIPRINIKINDIFNYVNYYYESLQHVIEKCNKIIKEIEYKWSKIKCDLTLPISDSIEELIELCKRSNFIRFEFSLIKLNELYSFSSNFNNSITNKYIETFKQKFNQLKIFFNNHDIDSFSNLINLLTNYNFDENLIIYFCDAKSRSETSEYSIGYLFKKLGIKDDKLNNLTDKILLVELYGIVKRIEDENE